MDNGVEVRQFAGVDHREWCLTRDIEDGDNVFYTSIPLGTPGDHPLQAGDVLNMVLADNETIKAEVQWLDYEHGEIKWRLIRRYGQEPQTHF